MTIRVSIFAAIAAVIFLTVIFELIRSRRLHERYAILWLITGGVIFVLAVWRGALSTLSSTVGIAYPPSALFVLALALHPGRAPALLDGDLEARRPEPDPRAAPRPARERHAETRTGTDGR